MSHAGCRVARPLNPRSRGPDDARREPREDQGRQAALPPRDRLRAGPGAPVAAGSSSAAPTSRSTTPTSPRRSPSAKELGRHESYVTGLALAGGEALVSGGYDGRLIWWDTESRSRAPVGRGPRASGSAASRPRPTARSWPASPTTWSAGSGTPPTGRLIRELRGHDETTPHHFPVDALRLRRLPRRPHAGHRRQGRAASSSGKSRPAGSSPARSADDVYVGPDRPPALDRRHPRRWPSRPTARGSPSAGSARSATSTTSKARPASRSSTGGRASGPTSSPATRSTGSSSTWSSTPGGDWLLAAGGANDGFLMSFDLDAKKAARPGQDAHARPRLLRHRGRLTLLAAGDKKLLVVSLGE